MLQQQPLCCNNTVELMIAFILSLSIYIYIYIGEGGCGDSLFGFFNVFEFENPNDPKAMHKQVVQLFAKSVVQSVSKSVNE